MRFTDNVWANDIFSMDYEVTIDFVCTNIVWSSSIVKIEYIYCAFDHLCSGSKRYLNFR